MSVAPVEAARSTRNATVLRILYNTLDQLTGRDRILKPRLRQIDSELEWVIASTSGSLT